MTFNDFINKYNGKGKVGNTKENTGECVGLVMVWVKELGLPHIWGHAKDLLINADPKSYERIDNTPTAIPQAGDIIVWKKEFNSTYGHTAIATGTGNINTFEVFEQNNPLGTSCRLHTYKNYAYVDGWLRPRVAPVVITPQGFIFNDQTMIPLGAFGTMELQALKGILGDYQHKEIDYENQIADRDMQIVKLQKMISDIKTVEVTHYIELKFTSYLGRKFYELAKQLG